MKTLAVFLLSGFLLFSAGVSAQDKNCSLPPLLTSYMFERHGGILTVSSMGADELVDSINCLDLARQKMNMKLESLAALEDVSNSTFHQSLDNETKIKDLEMRLSALEITLQRAEETIDRLQLESSLQVQRHPAKPAVKPKTQVKKPTPTANPPKDD